MTRPGRSLRSGHPAEAVVCRRRVHQARSTRTLFQPSREARQPGGTTIVVSYSSTTSGPARGFSQRPARGTMVAGRQPWLGPKYAGRSPPFGDPLPGSHETFGDSGSGRHAAADHRERDDLQGFAVRAVAVLAMVGIGEVLGERGHRGRVRREGPAADGESGGLADVLQARFDRHPASARLGESFRPEQAMGFVDEGLRGRVEVSPGSCWPSADRRPVRGDAPGPRRGGRGR